MRILFGPQNDGLHISPDQRGAYEWWYFDALSDDGRYALVVIYFLGSPMSPYYKAVVDGKNPLPRDWCGVFVSLHEKVDDRWRERAYAYNLYRNGDFADDAPHRRVGNSYLAVERDGDVWRWHINACERGPWRGETRVDATFTSAGPLSDRLLPMGDKGDAEDHAWVCGAPVCRADVRLTLRDGQRLSFPGIGYHDHNFGHLPFTGTVIWYWARGSSTDERGRLRDTAVVYVVVGPDERPEGIAAVFGGDGSPLVVAKAVPDAEMESMFTLGNLTTANLYGVEHRKGLYLRLAADDFVAIRFVERRALVESPFYRRLPVHLRWNVANAAGAAEGIGEVFLPARLCGPITSWMMWTRMRRRS